MINRIIEFSCNNRLLVIFLAGMAAVAGLWSMRQVPLDAIPDLSEPQVIIYSRWDRSPDVIEDQVTYPLITALLGAPHVKTVRGYSDFGYSYIYVIFEENTDIPVTRARTMEYVSSVLPRLPKGVQTELGPDATGLGWVYQYVLQDTSGKHSLADLRSYEDWYLRYYLKALPGVADVASLGGDVRQYQITLDPNRLQAYSLTVSRVTEAVRNGNSEAGGRLLELGGAEYMVRGHGYAKSAGDLENIVVAMNEAGAPIRIKDLGQVVLGPELRRGVSDLDGRGEAVSGVVIMRQGANALDVINRVKSKLGEIKPGLPAGVSLLPVYDRSELILSAVDGISSTLLEVIVTVALVVLIFLWHVPSAAIPVITIPIAVLVAFIPFHYAGLTANVMSLGGIAIAVGALVDGSIVVVEQVHKKLEAARGDESGDHRSIIVGAIKEVAAPGFFALLVIAVSFLPVLTLEGTEGRLFRPLAYTKAFAMVVGAVLAITLDPALRLLFTRVRTLDFRPAWASRIINSALIGKIHPEERHPISRWLRRLYEPVARWSLRRKWLVIGIGAGLVLATVPVARNLGSELMPPLEEDYLLYMPSAMPGISLSEARRLTQVTDSIIRGFPEVERVFGKAGRAETPTDPAPLSMLETVIRLKPRASWRKRKTWYSAWAPDFLTSALRRVTPDSITPEQLVAEMNMALNVPGLTNAWTAPIRGRIDMLTTGIRTPVGLKISGGDIETIERIGTRVERLLGGVRGTRSVFAERAAAGYFLDIDWNREALAGYGLTVAEAQDVVLNAVGGENVTTTVEGRERYPVNVRYQADFRQDPGDIERILVADAEGKRQVPLSQLASVRAARGASMIRNEDGLLAGYVYVDLAERDAEDYVDEAKTILAQQLVLPVGYSVSWSGQYETLRHTRDRLKVIVPLTLGLIFLLLFLNTRSVLRTAMVLLSVPFSAVGAVWFVYLLGYKMSVGVWVGLIALLGIDAETGVFMLLYLDLALQQAKSEGRLTTRLELHEAILQGAVTRLRPKFMTVTTMALGLIPIMWSAGAGADVMKRVAAPMIGGIFTSFLLELLIYPAVYELWQWHINVKRRLLSYA